MSATAAIELTIDNDTGDLPLYLQIAAGLLEQIESGELSPGERLPPERKLSNLLGVTRSTLRRALQRLEVQGVLVRRQGAGTYVAAPKIEQTVDQRLSFSHQMQKRGYLTGTRLLHFDRRPAEATVANALRIPLGARVFHCQRLHCIDQSPAVLETIWMPAARFPNLEQFDWSKRLVYDIIEQQYGVVVSRGRQSLEAVVATEYEAGVLGVQAGAPLMLERRTAFDQHDRPVEYGKRLYRGDRFRFVTEMAPTG